MNNTYKLLMVTACLGASISACKLDPPIFPENKSTNVTGTTGTTGTTGATETSGTTGTTGGTTSTTVTPGTTPQLTSKWISITTNEEKFDLTYNVHSNDVPLDNFYEWVQIDDATQTAQFVNTRYHINDKFTYILTKENGKTYIRFNEDPFFRTANFRIEITNLNASSMTWIAIDPKSIDIGGGLKGYIGNKITFGK